MRVRMRVSSRDISMQVDPAKIIYSGDMPEYIGPYTVTPSTAAPVVLRTAKKIMKDDVTVREIPFFAVSNQAGGETVSIGTEV